MQRQEHVLGEAFAYRFAGPDPDHALLVMHGIASHGGIYDNFGAHYAARGAEVWCMDAPGHGRSCISQRPGQFTLGQWVDAALAYADHIADTTGLPVVIKGSSLGAAAAYCALAASSTIRGAVLMGYLIPSSPLIPADNPFRNTVYEQIEAMYGDRLRLDIDRFFDFDKDYGYVGAKEQKHADPLNTWHYDMASWASLFRYEPAVALADNTKPILFTVGELDPTFPPALAKAVAETTGGPTSLHVHPQGKHQLMLFHTAEYTDVVSTWCRSVSEREEAA